MLRYRFAVTLALPLCLSGCHSSTPVAPSGSKDQFTGRSIADMQAEYDKLQAQNDKDCLYASPAQIKANQALCAREREQMAPLGNALMEAKVKASQHAVNP